jgi:Spy/CpxP family protein refolding chaperone
MQLADQISKRFTQSMADAADVLTADQRAKLAELRAKRHGRSGAD